MTRGAKIYWNQLNFKPELKSRDLGRSIMKQLVALYGESHLGGCMPAYDGRSILYVAGTLPFDSKEFEFTHANKDGRKTSYSVSIRFAKTLDPNTLKSFLQGRQRDCPYDTIQALDVVLRQHPSENYVSISRSFFSTKFGRDALEDGLECWKGYFQSLRPTQMGLSLNADICATAFYKAVSVLEFVREYLNLDSIQQLFQSGLLEHQRIKIRKALKGVRVATTHNPDVPRRYKIVDITQFSAREIMFTCNEFGGTEISVSKYLKEKYNCNLKYDWLPCIKAGSDTRALYLPLEVHNLAL
ncbi:hypothetical protein HPP92_015199 [Vanilla planifolia]|uniref:PAZ domain-containing protein n=1 Tax=Vanilla planifolia TaxID=51239 RepID=A0A835QPP5_VANPL|nr:hypothetical protein HPP92_015199 [Vanilla planifolia]